MRIAILHNAVGPGDSLEDQDVLVQAQVVAEALRRLGHEPAAIPCTLDLAAMRDRLRQQRPDVVFNLVESLDGDDSLGYLAPAVLDALGLAYTGTPTEGLFLTGHKLLAKQWLRKAGLPTPEWISQDERAGRFSDQRTAAGTSRKSPIGTWIVKGVWEQASRNLDDDAVLTDMEESAVHERLQQRAEHLGRQCYAERFIAGREFNVALLAGPEGPEVLPPAEIDFSAFPPGKPRIVGYRAKWLAGSFEYHHTPRTFDFPPHEQPLLEGLRSLAKDCWELFDLRGYARVDFRVDASGQPWILEVNTNPCLSPDAGFAAAVQQAAIPFPEAIARILYESASR